MRLLSLILACFLLPTISYASVKITEIAWMGTPVSANDEWIELHNDGPDAVALEGWLLQDGMNLSIPLSGTLSAGAYGVLERTDDSTVPGTAFLIYAGSLTNAGATLTLYDAQGSVEDTVVGGDGWTNIGGDNSTKDTPQLTDSGWVTAPPTPGFGLTNYVPPVTTQTSSSARTTNTTVTELGGGKVVQLHVPQLTLQLAVAAPDIAYVDVPTAFKVLPSGLASAIQDSLAYEWNFGDLTTGTSTAPTHTFLNAGEYVVTVRGSYALHQQVARKTITVLPVSLALAQNSKGDVLLHNNSKYEVDVSNYTLPGLSTIVFPPRSIILPQATITIPKERFSAAALHALALYDPQGIPVARLTPQVALVTSRVAPLQENTIALDQRAYPQDQDISNFSFTNGVATTSTSTEPGVATDTPKQKQQGAAALDAAGNIPNQFLPYLGLLGVVAIALLALFAARIG